MEVPVVDWAEERRIYKGARRVDHLLTRVLPHFCRGGADLSVPPEVPQRGRRCRCEHHDDDEGRAQQERDDRDAEPGGA